MSGENARRAELRLTSVEIMLKRWLRLTPLEL